METLLTMETKLSCPHELIQTKEVSLKIKDQTYYLKCCRVCFDIAMNSDLGFIDLPIKGAIS